MHSHKSDQLVERDAAVLAPGYAISPKLAAVEPLGDGPWGDIANLGDLAGGEHILWRIHTLLSPETAVRGLENPSSKPRRTSALRPEPWRSGHGPPSRTTRKRSAP